MCFQRFLGYYGVLGWMGKQGSLLDGSTLMSRARRAGSDDDGCFAFSLGTTRAQQHGQTFFDFCSLW
jgi:hypothetical protein